MSIRDEVVASASVLARTLDAGSIIIISPEATAIRKQIDTAIPVIIARVLGGRGDGDDIFIDIMSKLPKNIGKSSLFLKVSRIELMSEAVEVAYIRGKIPKKIIVGIVSIGDINSIVVMDINDIPLIQKMAELASGIDYTVLKAVLNLAIDIGREGREGKKIGTAFVIGDTEHVLNMSHQIVLNPYEGHKKKDRDIKDEKNWETVKEFAQLDGMFIVDMAGYIVAAGRYLDVNARNVELPSGLGGRHLATAAISKCAKAIAIAVSESSGVVSVYKDGKDVITIDPRVSIT
ncbi:MAG TPA: diadenylate cyclase [Methanocella sp.]|uniref:DNA integrity scanning protein DisA nucleotide-binding domain protein n=1 Tax=Methanocella sp. TaxID=2052833 RepID=UPI002C9750CA|nr:diadenylate cyclase [Methanocella sp.]HTY90053.1 diadenylate cyclase [Methanocella sp.]